MTRVQGASIATILLVAAAACGAPDASGPMSSASLEPAYAKPGAGTTMSVVTLPSLGSGQNNAVAINDAQEVAGMSGSVPARWARVDGAWVVTKLGTSAGIGVDVNEAGTVVTHANGGVITLWRRDGSSTIVGAGIAVGLNESETVVGREAGTNLPTAWVLANGGWSARHLAGRSGVVDGASYVGGINDAGVIVGYEPGQLQKALVWRPVAGSPGVWEQAAMLDVPPISVNAAAIAIEGDLVAGLNQSCTDPADRTTCSLRLPYVWHLTGADPGALGTVNGFAEGLNATGTVVGSFFPGRTGARRAFVWSSTSSVRELPLPKGAGQAYATDVNNATASRSYRQAVGEATSSGAFSKSAVVWTIP
jgi:hypothetical protein